MGARAFAMLVTALAFAGSSAFTLAHPKNPAAPLQPEVPPSPTATSGGQAECAGETGKE